MLSSILLSPWQRFWLLLIDAVRVKVVRDGYGRSCRLVSTYGSYPSSRADESSLDGGGVRGLSSVIIIGYLMDQLSAQRGRQVEPWEEFDMIGGASTGG